MAGYHKERYETECSNDECKRKTVRTAATMRTRAPDVMIRCRECGHINKASDEPENEIGESGRFSGVFS